MKTPSLRQFKQYVKANASLAYAVAAAQAFAQCERERVDAYIKPLLAEFQLKATRHGRAPEVITEAKNVYLCEDEQAVADFFKACDIEHRKHGFTGPEGHCPALTAENLQMKAERALLSTSEDIFGVNFADVYGEDRVKALDLLMGACLKSRKAA